MGCFMATRVERNIFFELKRMQKHISPINKGLLQSTHYEKEGSG